MPNPKATLQKVREICATLDEVTEGTHFDSVAFKSRGRMFATFREHGGDCEVVFALEPEHMEQLLAADARFQKYPRAPAISIHGSEIDDWAQMAKYLRESCALAAPRKAKPKSKTTGKTKRAKAR